MDSKKKYEQMVEDGEIIPTYAKELYELSKLPPPIPRPIKKIKLINAGEGTIGTSFHDITIKATANELMMLAEDHSVDYWDNSGNIYEKSQYDFDFKTPEEVVFTVYDWKEYREFGIHETLIWHIGGKTEKATRIGLKILKEQLKNIRK